MGWELFKTASRVTGQVENVPGDSLRGIGDLEKPDGFWIFSPDMSKWIFITKEDPFQSDAKRIAVNKLRELGGL